MTQTNWPNENWSLEQAIVATIAFFDVFSYPLTAFEVRQYLALKASFKQVIAALDRLTAIGKIEQQQGFFFLPGKLTHIITRQQRYNYTRSKLKIAKRWSKILTLWPGVKMVAVGNSIGHYNLNNDGDIDLFIITSKNTLWSTRFVLAMLTKVLGVRPTATKQRNRLCLSFLVSQQHLDLSDLKFVVDPYFNYWLQNLTQVGGSKKTFEQFIASNTWARQALPNWKVLYKEDPLKITDTVLPQGERYLQKLQWRLFPEDLKLAAKNNSKVVINNQVLKLHIKDRREEFFNKYLDNLKTYASDLE